MKCLACGTELPKNQGWEHLRSVHLAPLGLSPEKILEHARSFARPLEVRTAHLTCLKLPEKVIYFSIDNAELLIAYASERSQIPWTDIVEWQILHEKGHLILQGLYEVPRGVRAAIIQNIEDYYINHYLIPEQYWPVCLMNARCAVAIRTIAPVPAAIRDIYFYLTLATFLAYEAVTPADLPFLCPAEAEVTAALTIHFREIRGIQDLPRVCRQLELPDSPLLARRPPFR